MEGKLGKIFGANSDEGGFSSRVLQDNTEELFYSPPELWTEAEHSGIPVRESTIETFIGPASFDVFLHGTEDQATEAIKAMGFVESDPHIPTQEMPAEKSATEPTEIFQGHALDAAAD